MQISLKTRLALFSSVLAIVLTITTSLGSQFLAFRDLHALLEEQQSSQVKLVAEQLDTKFDDRLSILQHLARQLTDTLPSTLPNTRDRIHTVLQTLPIPMAFDSLFVVDLNGDVIYTTRPTSRRVNISDRPYFQEAVRANSWVISDVVYSRASNTPMVYMVQPIHRADGTVTGVVGGALSLLEANFLGRIARNRIGITGFYCLVSSGPQAIYVMHRDRTLLGAPAQLTNENCGENATSTHFQFWAPGVPLVSRYMLEKTGWELVAVMPATEAYAPLQAMHARMKTIAAIVAIVAGAAAWLATWYLLAPLSRLRDIVRRSHEDDGAYAALDTQRADEIGEVGREFVSLMARINHQNEALRRSETELRAGETRMRNIADHLPSLVAYLDRNQRYVFNNRAYEREFGRPAGELRGMHIRELLGESAYARIAPYLRRALAGEELTFEAAAMIPHGRMLWTEALYQPEWNSDRSEVIGIHILVRDITAEKLEVERLDALTQLDHLTGVANRKGFDLRLTHATEHAVAADAPFALLYLDLDHFKDINDTYGHAVGDAVLKTFTTHVLNCIRKSDTLARIGGDEFAIVIDGIRQSEQAMRVAESILEVTQKPFVTAGQTITIGVSIGIALSHGASTTIDDVKARADAALYRAKQQGRRGFAVDGR